MSQLIFPHFGGGRPPGRCCELTPCFQAQLEATAGFRRTHLAAEFCALHWGEAVQALVTWASAEGMTGHLTILAIDPPSSGRPAGTPGQLPGSLAFSTIGLAPMSGSEQAGERVDEEGLRRKSAEGVLFLRCRASQW